MRIRVQPAFLFYLILIALLSSYSACLCILLTLCVHEFFHYIACCLMNEQIEQIEITPFGGVMTYKWGTSPHKGIKGIVVNAAGPFGNYLMLLCISLLNTQYVEAPQFFRNLYISNASMLLLNLFPALPLDGGRIVFCLCYYFFPIVTLVRYLAMLGAAMGIAGVALWGYGLIFLQIFNCSLLIVSIHLILCAMQSRKNLLAENICTVMNERLSDIRSIQHIEQFLVGSDTPLYELIPYLKEGSCVSFHFQENEKNLELTEYAFCHAVCRCASLSVAEAYHRFSQYCEKTPKNPENTVIPS